MTRDVDTFPFGARTWVGGHGDRAGSPLTGELTEAMADIDQPADHNHNHNHNQDYGMLPVQVVLTLSAVGLVLGVCPFLLFMNVRRKSLRGTFLSNPVCAKCPAVRQCMLNCGYTCGIDCLRLGARDSLESIHDEEEYVSYHYDRVREVRRLCPTIVGVRGTMIINSSATSGYKWKKKWRDRRRRQKAKRRKKNAARKLRKQASQSTSSRSFSGVPVPEIVIHEPTDTNPAQEGSLDTKPKARVHYTLVHLFHIFRALSTAVAPSSGSDSGSKAAKTERKSLAEPLKSSLSVSAEQSSSDNSPKTKDDGAGLFGK